MRLVRRKPEESADGCRALEQADRLRAAAMPNPQMRESLEHSAEAWATRAALLERAEERTTALAAENVEIQSRNDRKGVNNG